MYIIKYRKSCGIADGEKFIITGGFEILGYDSLNFISRGKGLKTVTSYTKTGQIETLPQLIVGRYDHAWGHIKLTRETM